MLEAISPHTTAGPVVNNHILAEEALCALPNRGLRAGRARAYKDVRGLFARALATRATTVAELRFRLATLLETLEHEEASEYAKALLLAAIADVDHLSGTGPRADAAA